MKAPRSKSIYVKFHGRIDLLTNFSIRNGKTTKYGYQMWCRAGRPNELPDNFFTGKKEITHIQRTIIKEDRSPGWWERANLASAGANGFHSDKE